MAGNAATVVTAPATVDGASAGTNAALTATQGTDAVAQIRAKSGNSSDVDSEVQSNKPLFLNFTAELAPFNASKKQKRKSNVYKVSGVNILNRNSVDSKTALERLQRRRENHNFVERRRRDNINHTITSLSTLIPYCTDEGTKLNKGSILHMAVDYIRDLQDINQALSEENIRLGGNGNIQLPGRRHHRDSLNSSGVDTTAPHSQDEEDYEDEEDEEEDDYEERTLPQSLATSPNLESTANSIASAMAAAINKDVTPKRRRNTPLDNRSSSSSSKNGSKNSSSTRGRKKPAIASSRNSSLALNQLAAHHGHLPGTDSPFFNTAPPSIAQSMNVSPVALSASAVPVGRTSSRSLMPTAHQPPTSALAQRRPSSNALQHQTSLPPIGLVAPISATVAGSGASVPPGLHHASSISYHQQHMGTMPMVHNQAVANGARRQPAQSMPSSPIFRAHHSTNINHSGRFGEQPLGRQMPVLNSHPFFNSDISSIRHHLQQQQHLPSVLESSASHFSAANTPTFKPHQQQQYQQGALGESSAHIRTPGSNMYVAQSLQNTPLMRPIRDFASGSDAFELPPIALGANSNCRPQAQPQPMSQYQQQQQQQHQPEM
ncbi:hypothetical protein GGF37_003881 [Kickxella alabastrina]|nr:hypothetical protein GGF37_003881 [Kickxella alabastrina]